MRKSVLLLLTFFLLFSCKEEEHVEIVADGVAEAVADYVEYTFSIITTDKDPEIADLNNKKMIEQVREALKLQEGEVLDVVNYDFSEISSTSVKSYRITTRLSYKSKSITNYREIPARLIKYGGANISNPSFEVFNIEAVKQNAIRIALANAEAKANMFIEREKYGKIDEIIAAKIVDSSENSPETKIFKEGYKVIRKELWVKFEMD
ncbi:MAG: SIMPL domain-containing protein [Spirochaetales bacterium]|nr:SIMPL domain-containing protein [Spirochaetales bacterium]